MTNFAHLDPLVACADFPQTGSTTSASVFTGGACCRALIKHRQPRGDSWERRHQKDSFAHHQPVAMDLRFVAENVSAANGVLAVTAQSHPRISHSATAIFSGLVINLNRKYPVKD